MTGMTTPTLASLHVYPVRSLTGAAVGEAAVGPGGLAGDRQWLLALPDGTAVTQREQPRLALVSAERRAAGSLRLTAPGTEPLDVRVPEVERGSVVVEAGRGGKEDAVPAGPEADAWFSAYLGTRVRLVRLGGPVRSGNGYPCQLITVSSLNALNSLIEQGDHADEGPLPVNRFRPSFVVRGTAPWAEDDWTRIRIGEVTFRMAEPCGRCVVTATDQATAERGKEPLRTLARHRRTGDQVVFGRHLVPEGRGRVRDGDPVEALD